uniref:Uncharacterized protein n=1 Tax=Anguilla anguilla TaxID=7936 RepID=A0A0E9PDS7_ANGAN
MIRGNAYIIPEQLPLLQHRPMIRQYEKTQYTEFMTGFYRYAAI